MNAEVFDKVVAAVRSAASYPADPPFHPSENYPEKLFSFVSSGPNPSYESVRNAFILLGLDKTHLNMPEWNPLGDLIRPGDTVLLKPNLIRESHASHPDQWEQVITHGSVIRAVLDYVFIALKGQGSVTVADGPQTDSDFDLICRRSGLRDLVDFYNVQGLKVALLDLRQDRWFQKGDVVYQRTKLPGDPRGYTTVDLGDNSEFSSYSLNGSFYGADYNMPETASFHSNGRHAYVLCRTAMDADVIINLPKMKTHKKTGVTLSLKNMVGINGYRNCLPHHTVGTPDMRGDEFPVSTSRNKVQSQGVVFYKQLLAKAGGNGGFLARWVKSVGRTVFGSTDQVIRSGNWHGNNTAWRMVLDLNKVLFNFDGEGLPRTKPLRYLTIVDGIIAGDGDGPAAPDAKPAGWIVAGCSPVAVDTVCVRLMGFDYKKLPVIERAWRITALPLVRFSPVDIVCRSNQVDWNGPVDAIVTPLESRFKPHSGWIGAVELKD